MIQDQYQHEQRGDGDPPSEALISISKIFPLIRKHRKSSKNVKAPKGLCGRVLNAGGCMKESTYSFMVGVVLLL